MNILVHEQGGIRSIHSQVDFDSYCLDKKIITAAGGLVFNQHKELLMIFRRGHWDLPKGKVDPGETWEECAIREVIEETGITNLELIKFISTTYHTYEHNGSIILKPSHWFLMKTTSNQVLIPQREEDITEVKWVALSEISNHAEQSFGTIRDLLQLNELFT